MLGLVIIVILIVIAALVYVRFVVLGGNNEETKKSNDIMSIQAYNLMNSIINIKVCQNTTIREGLAVCKSGGGLCGNPDACAYLDSEIDRIARSAIYRDYSLNVSSSGWTYELPKTESCKFGVTSYAYQYNLRGDSYKAYFKLCQATPEKKISNK